MSKKKNKKDSNNSKMNELSEEKIINSILEVHKIIEKGEEKK